MKTAEEVKAAFMADLRELLARYGATLELEDRTAGWSYYPITSMVVEVPAVCDESGELVREYASIDLGGWIDGRG